MRVFHAAVLMALLASPAHAQQKIPRYGETDTTKTPSDIEQEKKDEAAYKRSLSNIRDQGPSDPWGTVRSPAAANTAPKGVPAKSRAKNAGAAN